MAFSFNDIEFALLLLLAFLLFFFGLKKREVAISGKYSGIDLLMSAAIKGISCVLILMGHYVTIRSRVCDISLFSNIIQSTTATIALTLFMFFSGYGLSVKRTNGGGQLYDMDKEAEEGLYSSFSYLSPNISYLCNPSRKVLFGRIYDLVRVKRYMVFTPF